MHCAGQPVGQRQTDQIDGLYLSQCCIDNNSCWNSGKRARTERRQSTGTSKEMRYRPPGFYCAHYYGRKICTFRSFSLQECVVDSGMDFTRISPFAPEIDLLRGSSTLAL